jgi:alanine dehydrogenase
MIIGIPKEIKDNEYRVSLTPGGAHSLVGQGHRVLVQASAGEGSGFPDAEYTESGATLVQTAAQAWAAEMVMKVKEPLPSEYDFLRPDLTLFTYLHLAAAEKLTHVLLEKKTLGIAYETVQLADGSLPLLMPMSEVAGRMAIQVGAHYLEKMRGGRGKLLGGVPGVAPCDVLILGGGIVGASAAKVALGMGAQVTIMDIDLNRLRYLSEVLHGNLVTMMSSPRNIANAAEYADLLVGAVLVAGAKAPRLVTREVVSRMKPGSVIVDVAVDQGGCVETVHATTHSDPVYFVDGVLHYCVANMPGAVPRTSTYALSNATLPYAERLARLGPLAACKANPALALGVNTYNGNLTYKAVADAFGLPYTPLETLLK